MWIVLFWLDMNVGKPANSRLRLRFRWSINRVEARAVLETGEQEARQTVSPRGRLIPFSGRAGPNVQSGPRERRDGCWEDSIDVGASPRLKISTRAKA
jgi:hypothetical protein